MVSFDGVTGYALKSEVELEGLTTVQIVSIVLCCAVAVTGVVVFVILWQARKKKNEKSSNFYRIFFAKSKKFLERDTICMA